jgi:hypothetical protein
MKSAMVALLAAIALGCSNAAVVQRAQRLPALSRLARRSSSRVVALVAGGDDEAPVPGDDAADASFSTDWDAVRTLARPPARLRRCPGARADTPDSLDWPRLRSPRTRLDPPCAPPNPPCASPPNPR